MFDPDILNQLSKVAKKQPDDYLSEYIKNLPALDKSIRESQSESSIIHVGQFNNPQDIIRFSLLFYDVVYCDLPFTGDLKIEQLNADWFMQNIGELPLIIAENGFVENTFIPNAGVNPTFMLPKGNKAEEFLFEISPLIKSGKLIVQPSRGVMGLSNERSNDGKKIFHNQGAAGHTPLNEWIISSNDNSGKIPVPIVSNLKDIEANPLAQITLPYISGVPFSDIISILEDEHDLISTFRSKLRNLTKGIDSRDSIQELVNDEIKPSVDILGRQLRKIEKKYKSKTVDIALNRIPITIAASWFTGLAGGLVAAGEQVKKLITTYGEYISERDDHHNNPYYLLWKLSQQKNKEIAAYKKLKKKKRKKEKKKKRKSITIQRRKNRK